MDEPRQPDQPGPEPPPPPPGWGTPPPAPDQGWQAPPRQDQGWTGQQGTHQNPYASQSQAQPPYGGQPPQPYGYGYPRLADEEAGTWAMLAHILGSFTSIIGPLIVWAAKKDEHPFVKDQATEALNFSITMLLVYVVGSAVAFVLTFFLIGILLFVALFFVALWAFFLGIYAGIKAKDGQPYRYPFNWRLIT